MRKIKIGCAAGWVHHRYEDVIEIDDDQDPEEVARDIAMEQFEWWWEEVEPPDA